MTAETTPKKKLLLASLIPALALGIVEVASTIRVPTAVVQQDLAPEPIVQPDYCDGCVMAA
jgi:hypothetical protein